MVKAENLMVDDPLYQVEQPKPHQHGSGEFAGAPFEVAEPGRPPQDEQSAQNEDVGCGMEDAVPKRIQFKVLYRIDRIPGAQHVMPLKNLAENDPVEEAAQTNAEQQAGRAWEPPR